MLGKQVVVYHVPGEHLHASKRCKRRHLVQVNIKGKQMINSPLTTRLE